MEEPYENENINPEVIEDLYVLKTKIDTSDITKLRRELQQIRYELAETQAGVRKLRNDPEGSFSAGGMNVTSKLKMELDKVKELKYQQSQIVNQINSGSIRDTEVFTRALSSLNDEISSVTKNSRGLEAAISVMEGAMGRMAAVSKKSQDYKQLQESFSSFNIDANITGTGSRLDLSKVMEERNRINNSPVNIKFDNVDLDATVDQLILIEALLKRIAAQEQRNIVLTKTLNNQVTSHIFTPDSGGSKVAQHAYVPPSFFVEKAQAVNRDNTNFTQPARAVLAAYHGTPLMSLDTRTQVRASSSSTNPRGTSVEDVRTILSEAGLIKQSPARNQFMSMGTSNYLDVSSVDKLAGVMDKVVTKIDGVILSDIRYLGDRYGQRRQLTTRSQMSGVIDGILSDESIGNMERAFQYQVSKMVSLFNIDWKDTGGSPYWMRGKPGANVTDKELAVLDLVDQFPGSMRSSEITHSLELGHYQTLSSMNRDLMKKGLLRRAIVPPTPIPEAGVDNQIHPAIMGMLAADPSLFMQFAMEASPIKFLDTSARGRSVLEMTGMYNAPSRINTGMQLNAMVGRPEDTLVENYKSTMALPPANAWWLRGTNMLNYGDSASGSKLLHHLEEMLNNQEAYNPEFMKSILPYIPHSKDAKTGRFSVDPEGWVGKESQFQYNQTNAGQYLAARSDLNWALRTPYIFIDKLMEGIARPNKDLFAKSPLGDEAYLKSVLNWSSGPQGRGINPQLTQYTVSPDQATANFKLLSRALQMDVRMEKSSDKFEAQYGRAYTPYNQYEKSVIIRAANEMLKRALPISSGMDPGTLELLRAKPFMSRGESGQVDKMLYSARQAEFSQLLREVPDLGRYLRAFETYQKSVLNTYNTNTSDLIGIFEENADTIGTAKPVPPEMRRRIANDQNAPASWKKYPEFWGAGYGNTYEDIYTGNTVGGSSADPNITRVAMSKINAQSDRSAIRTSVPQIQKFKTDTQRSPLRGFTGVLPWNAALDYYSQYGSQELNPAGQKEYSRLMSNPADLMKELMWDYTYVEGEHTKNPEIKNVIMDTYGTVMKKHAMFGWVSELKDPESITALHAINDKYSDMMSPDKIDAAVSEFISKNGMQNMSMDMVKNSITQSIERQADDEILDWTDKFGIETVPTGDITNVFKMKPDGTVSKFYEYLPEKVPKEDVVKRMQYDMQKGRMDPGLLEKYARSVASQKTAENTGDSFRTNIEGMYRNARWDFEAMDNLPQLVENQALFGFARTGTSGTFDFAGKGHQAGADWSNAAVQDALGIDTSMIDDDMLHDMINTNMEFRGNVKQTVMDAMGMGSEKEWNQYIQYASQQVRQRLKRWEHISMSLKPSIDEFNENFMNGYDENTVNFREPYDFGDIQSEFGNISDVQLINWAKQQYYERKPSKVSKSATARETRDAQYRMLAGKVGGNITDWDKRSKDTYEARRNFMELPDVRSANMFGARQPMYSYSPSDDWFSMGASTNSISDRSGMLGKAKNKFGLSPIYPPAVKFSDKLDARGYYSLGTNAISISSSDKDPASVMYHEYMHSVGNEKLAQEGKLNDMVNFYKQGSIPMFAHSRQVGEDLRLTKIGDIFSDRYLKNLQKKDPAKYTQELERMAPFQKLFQGLSSEGVKNFYAMGEEIAIVMEKYHDDYATHVQGLFNNVVTDEQKMKVAYIRNLVGIKTAYPTIQKMLPAGQTPLQLTDGSEKRMFNPWETITRAKNPAEKLLFQGPMPPATPMGTIDTAKHRYDQWQTARDAKIASWMKELPDASVTQPGKLVKERGTEIPFTYQLNAAKGTNGAEGIYDEYERFKQWLTGQGYDVSKITSNVVHVRGAGGEHNPQGTMSGSIRIPDSALKGRQVRDIAAGMSVEAKEGFNMFNDQASRYEEVMDKMPKWTDAFTRHGKAIAGVSWQFTTLQMAALGIFFSMMSLVSVMGQGIGMIVGGVGDLEGMMKAKAMAGMSGNFTDTRTGQTFTGAYIDEKLGINDQTRVDAWKNLTDFTSTLTTMLSGFGAKVLTSPKFLDAANTFLNKLFDVLTNDDNLKTVVDLSATLFETLGSIAEKLPGLIKLFETIASIKVPEGVPGIGGQSALSVYGGAALLSLIAMPILAGVTLLTKLTGWTAESVGLLGGISRWNEGRILEKQLLDEGYPKEFAAAAREAGGIPRLSAIDTAFYGRNGINTIPTVGLPEGYVNTLSTAEKTARLNMGRAVADEFATQGIKAGGDAIVTALEKAAMSIEVKAAGLMVFTQEDLLPKEALAARENAALAQNKIPDRTGMIGIPFTDIKYDVGTLAKEYSYGITHPSGTSLAANMPGVGPAAKVWQMIASFRRSFDAANLTGKTAEDTNAQYGWQVTNPMTGEKTPWAHGMNIPEEWQTNENDVFGMPTGVTSQWNDKNAEKRKEFMNWMASGLSSGFASVSPVDEPSWMPTTEKQANKLANEPLDTKWQKENSSNFNQTNYINMSVQDERLNSMDAKLDKVTRILGA